MCSTSVAGSATAARLVYDVSDVPAVIPIRALTAARTHDCDGPTATDRPTGLVDLGEWLSYCWYP
jgi:hypothetical protein